MGKRDDIEEGLSAIWENFGRMSSENAGVRAARRESADRIETCERGAQRPGTAN